MKLNELRDNQGARKAKKRLGQGMASGKGKTAGRGQKGQKARSGVSLNGFEGGQMPLYQRLPKRGFNSRNRVENRVINLNRLQAAIESGKLKKGADVNEETLISLGLVGKGSDPIRLLAKGDLKDPLNITVTSASEAAVKAVEKIGGKVTLTASKAS